MVTRVVFAYERVTVDLQTTFARVRVGHERSHDDVLAVDLQPRTVTPVGRPHELLIEESHCVLVRLYDP